MFTQWEDVTNFGSFSKGWSQNCGIFFWKFLRILDFRDDQSDDLTADDAGNRVKLVVRRNVRIPTIRVLNREPFAAKAFHFGQISRIEKPELNFRRVQERRGTSFSLRFWWTKLHRKFQTKNAEKYLLTRTGIYLKYHVQYALRQNKLYIQTS